MKALPAGDPASPAARLAWLRCSSAAGPWPARGYVSGVTPLPDVSTWARGSGLEIVLLVTGAILLTRFATWLGGKITHWIDASAREIACDPT